MQPSATRVASRYIEAIVVPPRRDREYAMYHAFLKGLKRDWAEMKDALPLLDKGGDALWAAGLTNPYPRGATYADKLVERFDRELGDRRDIALDLGPSREYFQERQLVRQNLGWLLQDAERQLGFRDWATKLREAVTSSDFDDEAEYSDLAPAEINRLKTLPDLAEKIADSVELLRKRMGRLSEPTVEGIPEQAEAADLETLYHASVKARQLAQKGFDPTVPDQSSSAGLGGSQSLRGGGAGISFTEDQYVAKEIARVFKEVAMVAQGEVTAREVLDWARRSGKLQQVIEWFTKNYANLNRFKERLVSDGRSVRFETYGPNPEHIADVKAGRAEYDPKLSHAWTPAPLREAFGDPVAVMGLYLSYLRYSGRYDPKFFGVGGPSGLVRRFKGLNPKDIGYIAATVNMTDPRITYGKGEREYRVPPEAVVSVDRFIR